MTVFEQMYPAPRSSSPNACNLSSSQLEVGSIRVQFLATWLYYPKYYKLLTEGRRICKYSMPGGSPSHES